LIAASVKFSFRLSIGCPKKFAPGKKVKDWVSKNKKKIFIYHDPKKAAMDADVIFSDKVISLNDKVNKKRKKQHFQKFKIKSYFFLKNWVYFIHICKKRFWILNHLIVSAQISEKLDF